MKNQQTKTAKAAEALLCIMALVVAPGCSSLHNRVSGTSWSQTAANEEQQQQLNNSPQGDLNMVP
jgi:hypothetical protein